MGLKARLDRIRAESGTAVVPFDAPVVLVVVADAPVGRTVVRREVLSPFAQRIASRTVPTGGTAPLVEGR